MKYILLLLIPLSACVSQEHVENLSKEVLSANEDSLKVIQFYKQHQENEQKSKSLGTVSNGSMQNGKLIPFYGANFTYFDQESYLGNRAFTSDAVKSIILETYISLSTLYPGRKFYLMELSNQKGGKIYPHRTHQNGLSVDFMMPKTKNGVADYSLDTLGTEHYFLEFNDNGEYVKDTSIKVDFDIIAKHILLLHENANKLGYKISKVIIKIEYKDELFATPNGILLKNSGIYVVNNLTPLINSIHDDHYHVDFEKK